jgi:hypothetical protein
VRPLVFSSIARVLSFFANPVSLSLPARVWRHIALPFLPLVTRVDLRLVYLCLHENRARTLICPFYACFSSDGDEGALLYFPPHCGFAIDLYDAVSCVFDAPALPRYPTHFDSSSLHKLLVKLSYFPAIRSLTFNWVPLGLTPHYKLSTIGDSYRHDWAVFCVHRYFGDFLNDFLVSTKDSTKHNVLTYIGISFVEDEKNKINCSTIKMRTCTQCYEELGAVRVGAFVRHTQQTITRDQHSEHEANQGIAPLRIKRAREVFVSECSAIDGLSS